MEQKPKSKAEAALEMSRAFAQEYIRTGNHDALVDSNLWYDRYLDALLDLPIDEAVALIHRPS